MKPIVLEAKELSRNYRLGSETIHALDRVNLTVRQGEFLAVMGPSGSGKSTLLHLLGLVDQPDSGDIIIAGQATNRLDDDTLTRLRRERLGFIFQQFELIPTLSAKENILLPAEIAGQQVQARQTLDELASYLGIAERLNHYPGQLSGGQRQRVAIARALINRPQVILADEPTGNLDSQSGAEVISLLERGVKERGWTVVMVTHDAQAAARASRIVKLKDGRIVQTASAKDATPCI
jgi:putative ABC transport system ATP-binding protein